MHMTMCFAFANCVKAGTLKYAELRPDIPAAFCPASTSGSTRHDSSRTATDGGSKFAGRNARSGSSRCRENEFDEDGLDDGDLLAAGMSACAQYYRV